MRALIVTYYFPPYVGIEGQRPASWANLFPKKGIQTDVVTRKWSNEVIVQKWEDYLTTDSGDPEIVAWSGGRTHYVPHRHRAFYSLTRNVPILGGMVYWFYKLIGHFHIETDAYHSFKEYLEKLCDENQYDFIITTSPPLNLIRLGFELAKKKNAKFIADFRDTYDNRLMNVMKKIPLKRRVENFLFRKHLSKWIKKADLNVVVSPAMVDVLPLSGRRTEVIFNGFEEELFLNLRKRWSNKDLFVVLVLGNLYESQEIDMMLEGYSIFLSKINSKERVRFDFIGLGKESHIAERIKRVLPTENVFVTNRIKRDDALGYLSAASVCFNSPGPRGFKGILGGKTFDYIGAGKFILVCPSDDDILFETINEFELGRVVNTSNEIAQVLGERFLRWKEGEEFCNDFERIKVFSRENQAERLLNSIESVMRNS